MKDSVWADMDSEELVDEMKSSETFAQLELFFGNPLPLPLPHV
jgi:hypothetical protein